MIPGENLRGEGMSELSFVAAAVVVVVVVVVVLLNHCSLFFEDLAGINSAMSEGTGGCFFK